MRFVLSFFFTETLQIKLLLLVVVVVVEVVVVVVFYLPGHQQALLLNLLSVSKETKS